MGESVAAQALKPHKVDITYSEVRDKCTGMLDRGHLSNGFVMLAIRRPDARSHAHFTYYDRRHEIVSIFHLLLGLCIWLLKQQMVTRPSRSDHQGCRHGHCPRKQTLASPRALHLSRIDVGHGDVGSARNAIKATPRKIPSSSRTVSSSQTTCE